LSNLKSTLKTNQDFNIFDKFQASKKSVKTIISFVNSKPWTIEPYKKENWGNKLHSTAPYIGRIKPAFAHWLIKLTTNPNDVVLDPFCGIGTVPLESDLLGRRAIGYDLNDYAITISKAKFDRRPLEDNINWLNNVKLNPQKVDLESVSPYVKQFYHPKTLAEILSLKQKIIECKRDFLLGCLIGIIHGHRPQYLSAWTGYIIPFVSSSKPEYREVLPRMIAKVTRMYSTGFPLETHGIIKKQDVREIKLPEDSVDSIISSPPYFDTIDYVSSNRLRLAFLGISDDSALKLKKKLIQQNKTYLEEMNFVGKKLHKILKNNSLCVFVLGDVHKPKYSRNTALEISEQYADLGFKTLAMIDDEIPLARRTANKWKGEKNLSKTKRKLDRILIMKVKK